MAIHSAIFLLRLSIVIVLGIHLDFGKDIAGILQIFDHSVHRFFTYTQLPLRIFDENLYDLNWVLFFQNL